MVQLKAATLGADTSNTNQALAEGLAGLTQGMVQGMKLRFLKEQQQREQATFEREENERKAAQRGMSLLGGEEAYQLPDSGAQVDEAMPQIQAGADAVRDATRGTPVEFMGDMISRGAMSSSKPLGQHFDWENLKKHQAEFAAQMQQELAQADPREAAFLLAQMKEGFKEDASLLHRSHAVSQGHDEILGGAFDTFTASGEVLRDEAMMKSLMGKLEMVENGQMSPEQYEATVGPLREQAHASWVENKQRFYLAQSAQRDLDQMSGNGDEIPDAAVSAQHELAVGRYDPKQFKADWPELKKGNIKYKGDWERPETVAKLQLLERQLLEAQTAAAQALAQQRRADAQAKSPMGQVRRFMYERALQKAKLSDEQRKEWGEAYLKSRSVLGRTEAEAVKDANTATGQNIAPVPDAGGGDGKTPPPDGAKDYQGAANALKGKSRVEVTESLAAALQTGQIDENDVAAIVSAMGGLPSAPGMPLDPNYKKPASVAGEAPNLKAKGAEIDADRQRLADAEKLPPDQAREVEKEIMKKYGLKRGELLTFKRGDLRPDSGVLKR